MLVVSDATHPSSKFSRWNIPMPLQLFWMPSVRAGADSLPPSLASSDLSQRFCVFCTFGQDKTHKSRHGGVQSKERRVALVSATLHLDKPWSWGEVKDELVHSLWLAIFIHIPRPKGETSVHLPKLPDSNVDWMIPCLQANHHCQLQAKKKRC